MNRKVEIISVEELKRMIVAGKVENAGTLIAYLMFCTGISVKNRIGYTEKS